LCILKHFVYCKVCRKYGNTVLLTVSILKCLLIVKRKIINSRFLNSVFKNLLLYVLGGNICRDASFLFTFSDQQLHLNAADPVYGMH
jgi:hypothetical protein